MFTLKQLSLCLALAFLLSTCSLPLPALEGIDLVKWKSDKNGCGGDRASMIEALRKQRNKLEGLTESQIVELLGRPDQNELYKRNQKFYYFFLQPSPACGPNPGKALRLRR